jgi:hypothetical protein
MTGEFWMVGGLAFWAAMIAWVVILWSLVQYERGFLGFCSTVAYLALLQFGYKLDILDVILHNKLAIPVVMALYFVCGVIFAFWWWYRRSHELLEPYLQMRSQWLESKGESNHNHVPPALQEEWSNYIQSSDERKKKCATPRAREHKAEIMRKLGYWPIHLLTWLFYDMLRDITKAIYNYIADWLQSITDSVFATVKKDLPQEFKK